jgi:hypothetical protein
MLLDGAGNLDGMPDPYGYVKSQFAAPPPIANYDLTVSFTITASAFGGGGWIDLMAIVDSPRDYTVEAYMYQEAGDWKLWVWSNGSASTTETVTSLVDDGLPHTLKVEVRPTGVVAKLDATDICSVSTPPTTEQDYLEMSMLAGSSGTAIKVHDVSANSV